MRCEEVRGLILEQTLEGGPLLVEGPLAQHLQACPLCRAFLARVAVVDSALRDLPLMAAPAGLQARVLQRVPRATSRSDGEFLPWTLWVPVLSLVSGAAVACVTLLVQHGPAMSGTFSPSFAEWLSQAERWMAANGAALGAVTLSVTAGLLFMAVAIGLGLYVGRTRMAHPR